MGIKIVEDGPDIVLSRSEYEQLYQEWEELQRYTSAPKSFETWLRRKQGLPEILVSPTPRG